MPGGIGLHDRSNGLPRPSPVRQERTFLAQVDPRDLHPDGSVDYVLYPGLLIEIVIVKGIDGIQGPSAFFASGRESRGVIRAKADSLSLIIPNGGLVKSGPPRQDAIQDGASMRHRADQPGARS